MKKICVVLSLFFVFTLFASCGERKFSKTIPDYSIDRVKEQAVINEVVVLERNLSKKNEEIKAETENNLLETKADYQGETVIDNTVEEKNAEEKLDAKTNMLDEPNLTMNNASSKILLASGSTDFNPNQIERSNNIRLAASFINGLIINPGDEFSFNKVVGKRTAERGFLPADIFVGQSVAKGYGGGVCQTSSTVCIAVRKTNLKILEQNPHSQRVTYTTIDNEAMINYGTSDFRFINTYDTPILLEISFVTSGDREIIKCDIYLLE